MKKKNPHKSKEFLRRHALRCLRSQRRWREWKRRQGRLFCDRVIVERLVAPRFWNLARPDARARVLDFLDHLRKVFCCVGRTILLDFQRTEKLFSCATLLLVAEVDRLRRTYPNVVVRTHLPRNLIARQVLQQVGLLKLIGHKHVMASSSFDETVKNWRYATGHCTDASRISDEVWDAMDGRITPALRRSIFKGITEAMTNSVHHAYVGERGDGVRLPSPEKRWWMFSQELEGHLHVVVCDLGVGIQHSLPRNEQVEPGFMARLGSFLSNFQPDKREAATIKAAVEIGRTRTQLHNRGKGLKQIVDTIVTAGDTANMVIYSNCGAYWVESSSSRSASREKIIQYDGSIMGTLIQWRMPVTEQEA